MEAIYMKEKISKILMGIVSLIIAIIAIYCLFKGKIIGAIIILLIAILLFPLVQDYYDKKYSIQNEYYKELRFVLTFFTAIFALLLANVFINIMEVQGYEENLILDKVKELLQIIIYIVYLVVLFMYSKNEESQKNKYILFGTIYFVFILISYIPDDTMVLILNKIPDELTLCSYRLLIDAIIDPIKEAILTYIIFDTVMETKKHNEIEEDKESTENKTEETNTQSQYNGSAKFEVEVKDNKTGYECNYEISVKQKD